MSKIESYPTPSAFYRQMLDEVRLPELPELSTVLCGKLRYYAEETPDFASPLSAEETIRSIFAAENRGPEECIRLLEALSDYEVVCPNMFLTERIEGFETTTTFDPHGSASRRLSELAGRIVQSIKESRERKYDPELTGLNHEALAEYVYESLQSSLAGPFGSILDIGADRPILVLNDTSYTSLQTYRAFSGIYCDFTPALKLSKADFMEFCAYHEIAHKISEEIAAEGPSNRYLPGIDLGIEQEAISHANLLECIADAYAVLKHMQRTGSRELPEQIATMRMLQIFSQSFKQFETSFTLGFGGAPRRRSEVEHFTAPVLDALIPRAAGLHQARSLQEMNDKELMTLAIESAREMKMSGEGLVELSRFATSLTFNVIRENLSRHIPEHKDSISPNVVQWVLDCVEDHGSYVQRGGSTIEMSFLDRAHRVSPELRSVFSRYREAIEYLRVHGIAPFTTEASDHFVADLLSTLSLPSNHTPNTTIARELNDSWASEHKYAPFSCGHFNLIGVKALLEHCGVREVDSFEQAREYRMAIGDSPRTAEIVLKMFGE